MRPRKPALSALSAFASRASRMSLAAAVLCALGAPALVGCSKADASSATKDLGSEQAPVVVTDDAKGLLFTWIDEKGEFHVEEGAGSIPPTQRDHVRVIDPAQQDPPGQVHLVDLRRKTPEGVYAVTLASRASFDAVAASRRAPVKVASGAAAEGADSNGDRNGARNGAADVAGRKSVVVYGASWCGACQKTRAYLKGKGIPFVDKDIDVDSSAAREMRSKLAKAGMQSQGIPVIDVGGKLMVGFDPNAIEQALHNGG